MHTVTGPLIREIPAEPDAIKTDSSIRGLTALWALSEAGLGGVLHITRLPFKGILIAGAATLFISLLGNFARSRGTILKSTLMVLVVKYLVSPHTPVTAAIAVFMQGLLGELFFATDKLRRLLVPAFAILIQFITAMQKILIITILFGKNFWVTVDEFANLMLNELIGAAKIEFSLLIIIVYIIIHIFAGLIIGLFILKLLNHIGEAGADSRPEMNTPAELKLPVSSSLMKKRWYQKPSGIATLIFFSAALSLSFFLPDWAKSNVTVIMLMIARAVIIITLWYSLISPVLRGFISKLVSKQKRKHLEEIKNILGLFPGVRRIIILSWSGSAGKKGYKRIENFVFNVILYSLYY